MRVAFTGMLFVVALMLSPMTAYSQDEKGRLFVNLTTDDTWSAAKAIMFAHQKSLKNGRDTAIWLNVRAVYLADKKRPSNVPGLMAKSGTSIQDMLAAFMADGGTVIMCQACSAAAGLKKEDYMDGVEMGRLPVIESWLFAPGTVTLSW